MLVLAILDGPAYSSVSTSYVGGVSTGPLTNSWDFLYRAEHRNGSGDGPGYIMELASAMTSDGSLYWRKKYGSSFTGFRQIIDSTGGTISGTLNFDPNTRSICLRNENSYYAGIGYATAGNESVLFENKNVVTSWIFRTNTPGASGSTWDNITPSMQIKNQRVTINKLIANGANADYNLDVNGSANATTMTINGKATLQYNSTDDCIDFIFA